ncbi:MAG: hypothetical protein JWO77_3167, partial [Ilumatobacteraceae bacterium]|nr:hypothetical protein [Ilumatobacteraceae bacterium]
DDPVVTRWARERSTHTAVTLLEAEPRPIILEGVFEPPDPVFTAFG